MEGGRYVKLMPPLDGIVKRVNERLEKIEAKQKELRNVVSSLGQAYAGLRTKIDKLEGIVK